MSSSIVRAIVLFAVVFVGAAVAQLTPRPPATICVGRPHNFLVRDVTQCNAFFRCDQQLATAPVRHLCTAPAHVFSEPLQRCVPAVDGGSANCFRCPAHHALVDLPVADVCSHFVRCIAGQAQQFECPRGTLFDRRQLACNAAHLVECGGPAPPASSCPAQDVTGQRVWLRDASDCRVFRVCVNGLAVRAECPAGMHFNQQRRVCDLPQAAGCSWQEPPPPPPPTQPFRCAEQQQQARPIHPHPTDCTRFFLCDAQNKAFPRQCPVGTRFDTVQLVCDSPARAVCAPGAREQLTVDSSVGPWMVRNATAIDGPN